MRNQVLVAGAGPTGLTLALDLARRNVPVRVIDQATEFFAGSRGDGIQPRTLEVFDDLGVLDAVLAAGIPTPIMRAYLGGEFVGERRMWEPIAPTPALPYPNPWLLGQSGTEAILRERLAEFGVRVELGTALAGFEQDATGVTATLTRDGTAETVRVDYLVGADGGRSTVRKQLGIAFEGTTDESLRMLLGDVRADVLDHEFGYWFAGADRPMEGIALSPLPGGRQFQFAAPLTGDAEPTLDVLQEYADRYCGRTDLTLTELTWVTVWRPNVRLAERFRDGRVFLAGDAAHVHPPTGGQGMNTGIQDAYNLGWKLAAALDGDESLLDSYESERRTVAARVLGVSSALLDKLVDGDEDAMERGPETQQLDISYRDPADRGELVAGDRAPDAPLKDMAGNPIRLFDLFRGPHATVLCFGETAELPIEPGVQVYTVVRLGAAASERHVIDIEGHAFAAYAARPGTRIRIRPDGYVAHRA
ncbi:3-(3-hydroxyphenyl)propionate hydroxylase [Nocardia colli]|uniref:3-(3-hydroxyphenyl)propionate hydroxylase n=1 Tax=Nocardia colli TaxID=2545717 RepID=A0A5N0EA14_9NOCA|nr:FAD-dependent monooxygenase [Nocardia colli]KAA8885796.1 3-(3-hydroxyphenyl)propionate hydroxylase [Nocardia colli]